ncbi:MAG TPA: pyridoxal-phosphate dependent enzyme, partial [Candidatus Saccharimonadales bacterium]|nr:pyridoxal-phosphate dependent enzyme [Candidatus Saccharimonadales bacterium]
MTATTAMREAMPTGVFGANATAAGLWELTEQLVVPGEYAEQFRAVVDETPVHEIPTALLPSDLQHTGYQLLVKDEGRMRGGAYKLRGMVSALLPHVGKSHHVVAGSTGNHAKEGAVAVEAMGFESFTAYCPEDASLAKLYGIARHGGRIILTPDLPQALSAAEAAGRQPGHVFVHPYNMPPVVAGQGTATLELADQL